MHNLSEGDYPPGIFPYVRGFILGNKLYLNEGGKRFKPVGIKANVDVGGWAYGPACVDLDGDGRPDLYSPAGFQSVERNKPDG